MVSRDDCEMSASQNQPRLGDRQTATIIGHVLRSGVFAAGSVVLAGAGVYLVRPAARIRVTENFAGNLRTFVPWRALWPTASSFGGAA